MGKTNFTNDMQMLAEIIGSELTMKVIANLSGISIYIPKPDYNVIRFYHPEGGSVKRTAQQLGVSERMVYRALQQAAEAKSQLTIFSELEKQEH